MSSTLPEAKPSTLIVAEKPSVARDIARVIGANATRPGCLVGVGYTVTWAIGHLVALPEPHEIRPEWKQWRTSALPMLPEEWPLKVVEATRDQFAIVRRLLGECRDVICATDAGREGELIFRYIYEAAECRKRVRRLWISSLTPDAIRVGLAALKDGAKYDALADAARARSRADWLVGMNLSRAYALTYGDRYFVGRVQTPTLALVVQRDREIRDFKPEDYLELVATFGLREETYRGTYLGERENGAIPTKVKRLPPDGELAGAIVARVRAAGAFVHSADSRTVKQPPPLLYDLTELQRHANRLYGMSAAKTLEVAQSLYERHKLVSYPRTDSAYLSRSVAETLPAVVRAIAEPYRALLKPGTGETALGGRYVDDTQVTDHHAILPTEVRASATLGGDEKRIYDLICRRLLALWQGDYVTAVTTVLTASGDDFFRTLGTVVVERGWKALEAISAREPEKDVILPAGLAQGVAVAVADVKPEKKTTRPPPHLTDASLLAAMESAGRNLEDRELQQAMRDSGLGTPATRANIIETLLKREYLRREGKTLRSTELGGRLIDTVHPTVKSAELTGRWEKELALIQAGKRTFDEFMTALVGEIKERVGEVLSRPPAERRPQRSEAGIAKPIGPQGAGGAREGRPSRPTERPKELDRLLKDIFGFSSFRPHQEEICRAVTAGRDVLVVMPTGAGKSLCYQLPGIARGGTTLVISPLVALIDDQTEKLRRAGLRAERIHSGRSREESRAVCREYLAGNLDFLFVAPERLGVPGFPEMLRKRPLSLVAIDEAHCISHWGHDFRPDYRLLGERLGDFRPTPVIALTATATPLVQADIAEQLGLRHCLHSIHGFRRTNIAIQLAELEPGGRADAIRNLLKEKDRRPAIVYAPTRKAAEAIAGELKSAFAVEAYHAGMSASARDRVQERYLHGDLEVVVATIAFGMGIDKANVRTVVHAGLPGSVEGYYQEIGRAGRDGQRSRAVLFHSYSDRKTHEFLFEKSYPEVADLRKVHRAIGVAAMPKAALRAKVRWLDDDTFERALEKLWIHKGALIDPEENVALGQGDWETPYHEQREHRLLQLRQIVAFTESARCRMNALVEHFGDQQDSGAPCGICDVCDTASALAVVPRRVASDNEQRLAARIMEAVSARRGYPAGRLHQDIAGDVARRDFENVLGALVRAGWVVAHQETFEKDGEVIAFRKLAITEIGERASAAELAALVILGRGEAERKSGRKRRRGRKTARRSAAKPVSGNRGDLFEALREWRLAEAKRKRVPAFRILTDAVLQGICDARPLSEGELLEVHGLGPALVGRYGADVLRIVGKFAR